MGCEWDTVAGTGLGRHGPTQSRATVGRTKCDNGFSSKCSIPYDGSFPPDGGADVRQAKRPPTLKHSRLACRARGGEQSPKRATGGSRRVVGKLLQH